MQQNFMPAAASPIGALQYCRILQMFSVFGCRSFQLPLTDMIQLTASVSLSWLLGKVAGRS
jgi:hypothetical protein